VKAKNGENSTKKTDVKTVSKECAYLAVFVALTIAGQVCLAAIPGVEIVTVLFVSYAFVFGVRRGVTTGIVFSLLRQLIFGVYPSVLLLYLLYYSFLPLVFGLLGKKVKKPAKSLLWIVLTACLCTVVFTMLDNLITIVWYGYTERAARAYFAASFTVMLPQVLCTAVSVAVLFLPLVRVFRLVKISKAVPLKE
jgi:energy-coupling factor transport system substrate-specific component/cob(I)alamin adenosyltransferase